MANRWTLGTVLDISLVLFAAAIPWSIAAMQIAMALVVLAHGLHCKQLNRAFFTWHPLYYWLAGYLALRLLSVVFAPHPFYSLRAFWSTDWVVFLIPVFVSLNWEVHRLRRSLVVLLISSGLAGAYGIFQALTGVDVFGHAPLTPLGGFYRAIGGYNFYLTFAGNQLLAFALALGFFSVPEAWSCARKWLWLLLLILAGSLLFTFARSVWLAVVGMWFVAVWLSPLPGLKRLLPATLIFMVLLLGLIPEFRLRVFSIFDPAVNENRINLWHTAWRMIKTHPLWGIGPGMFNEVFEQYRVPGFYDATGHAHNDYLNTTLNSGIPTLLAWLGIWGFWFYRGIRRWWEPMLQPVQRAVLLGAILALSGILIAAFFQCYYTDLENNILWWWVVSLGAVVWRPKPSLAINAV